MDKQLEELKVTEKGLTQEIEDVHTNCQQIASTIENLQAQVNYAEEHKKRVRLWSELLLQSCISVLTLVD